MSAPCRPEDPEDAAPTAAPAGATFAEVHSRGAQPTWHPAVVSLLAMWLLEDREKEVTRGQLQ